MSNHQFYNTDGQADIRKKIFDLNVEYSLDKFDEQGNWVGEVQFHGVDILPGIGFPEREKLWYCVSYFSSRNRKAIKRANNIIRTIKKHGNIEDSFDIHASIIILKKFRALLENDCIKILEQSILTEFEKYKNPSVAFTGINDNFPSMDTFIALIGGRMFGRDDVYKRGLQLLGQLKALLGRRGVLSEYNSPTYTSIPIQCMADLANYTDDENVKKDALMCEERIWADLLSHYHPNMYQLAGPYSRSYTVDCVCHTHKARYVLYMIFGELLVVNPMNTLFSTPTGEKGEVIHNGIDLMRSECGWMANTQYHCPVYLAEAALNKSYPYIMKATTECRARNEITFMPEYVYPGGSGRIYTYMTENYALGTSSRDFSTGVQTNSFQILYRRHIPVKKQSDEASVYCKYIINEKDPNTKNTYAGGMVTKPCHFLDQGRKIGIQEKNTAVMIYKPKLWGIENTSSLKLSLMFPAHYGVVEKIMLGETELKVSNEDGLLGESIEPVPVIIKDGPVYMGFKPIGLTDYGRKAAVKVEKVGNFLMVSFYNYEGTPRDFDKRELLMTANGFAVEVRDQNEIASFNEFKNLMDCIKCEDYNLKFDVFPTERYVKVKTSKSYFECSFCPVTEDVKYITIDGNIPESPVFSAPNIDTKKLPFYNPKWDISRGL